MQLPPKVTQRAFERLAEIGAGDQGQALRVAVEGGGCSGFQYDIGWISRPRTIWCWKRMAKRSWWTAFRCTS